MPWLALPFGDKTNESVEKFYGIEHIPSLIVVDPDGKVVTDATDAIRTYGSKAYPFTDAHLQTVKKEIEEHGKIDDTADEDQYTDESYDSFEEDTTDEEESDRYEEPEEDAEKKAKRENQTLESLLVSDERNFLIKNGGAQVLVSELVGKIVGLYFSAHWCSPCRRFTPELVKVYNELKERGEAFEIVFLSSDHDQETFEEYYGSMPWLALPFGDKTKDDLGDLFEVLGVPILIVVHPDGEKVKVTNIATDVIDAIHTYGAKAYPFTDAHLQSLENKIEEHEKADTPREKEHEEDADAAIDENNKPAGVICDGDVCHLAR